MNWVITRNCLDLPDGYKVLGVGSRSAGKTRGDRLAFVAEHPELLPWKFRIRDDDKVVYFEGYASEQTFAPLDWARADAGATEIQYEVNGVWETL